MTDLSVEVDERARRCLVTEGDTAVLYTAGYYQINFDARIRSTVAIASICKLFTQKRNYTEFFRKKNLLLDTRLTCEKYSDNCEMYKL